MTPTLSTEALQAAADRLATAASTRLPCAPVRDLVGTDDVAAAYAVQREVVSRRTAAGARIVGRKIGLTSEAVQRQLGVDRPDFGVLLDDMDCSGDAPIALDRLLQPRVEAEIAFVLRADLTDADVDVDGVRVAVDHAVAALEIVDSRVAGWDITFGDTVADNASSGLFVLGRRQIGLDRFEPHEVTMTMTLDGDEVSTGTGAACLGNPLAALAWLARTAVDLGDPLRAGDIVLSGALGPMVALTDDAVVVAQLSGLGEVRATFSGGSSA